MNLFKENTTQQKTLSQFSQFELSKEESVQVDGGGWAYDLGYACGQAWSEIKDWWNG